MLRSFTSAAKDKLKKKKLTIKRGRKLVSFTSSAITDKLPTFILPTNKAEWYSHLHLPLKTSSQHFTMKRSQMVQSFISDANDKLPTYIFFYEIEVDVTVSHRLEIMLHV